MNKERGTCISSPLKTLEEVHAWTPGCDEYCVASVPLVKRPGAYPPQRPRTILCHDMAGGYLYDRFVQGSDEEDCYRYYHWHQIDTFIYFSHYFITIPPPVWTNASHKHGVPMLGTFITEWDDGKQRCDEFLSSEANYKALADKMVAIAKYYNFDGWLVNIENKIEKEHMANLIDFVTYLSTEMHHALPQSQVIWYDSVIEDGSLCWQNELNYHNIAFFEACDGIFINYGWQDHSLTQCKTQGHISDRPYDVYIGVDIWGRGCRGGGGFNTCEATAGARGDGLSMAIFAQGWVYESLGKEDFTANENKFWNLIRQFSALSAPSDLPLVSHFCEGRGRKLYQNGKVISEKAWTNHSMQSLQPVCERSSDRNDVVLTDAYHGGGCLRITGVLSTETLFHTTKLYIMNSEIPGSLLVSYTFKPVESNDLPAQVFLQLVIAGKDDDICDIYLPYRDDIQDIGESLMNTSQTAGKERQNYQQVMGTESSDLLKRFHLTPPTNGWLTKYYYVPDLKGRILKEVNLVFFQPNVPEVSTVSILLGQLQILDTSSISELPLLTNLHFEDKSFTNPEDNSVSKLLNGVVRWTFPKNTADHFKVFCKTTSDDDEKEFLGHTHANMFHVQNLVLKSDVTQVLFWVQPFTFTGFPLPMLVSCVEDL